MSTMNNNPVITPKQENLSEAKKELEKLAEEKRSPKLVESFNNLLAKKSAQIF